MNKNHKPFKENKIKLVFNKRNIFVTKICSEGMTSDIYRTNDGLIVKRLKEITPYAKDIFKRELFWLEKLEDSGVVPKVVDVDHETCSLLMKDVGSPISKENLPNDWKKQVANILKIFREHKCHHNDLSERELLVSDGKIFVVDFGVASVGSDMTCGGIFGDVSKNRIFDDRFVVNLIELTFMKHAKGSELHCFILWDISERKTVESELLKTFDIIQAITYSKNSIKLLGSSRLEFLSRFYHGRVSHHGDKGKHPFVLFVVIDHAPRYQVRKNYFNGEENIVNVNMFDTLQKLRKGRTSFLHGSDNTQEAYDNLESLTFYKTNVPVCYWETWRPKFSSLQSLFETLNKTPGLEYVVMRNFENLSVKGRPDPNNDIDFLVNDYYLFKKVSGAIGYKHKASARYRNRGQAYEYGGYKVAGKVSIEGIEIPVDIRFIGDCYYDSKWQIEILKKRVISTGFFVPDTINLTYSLMYHALVHKRFVTAKYRLMLAELMKKINIYNNADEVSDKYMWGVLDSFLDCKGYKYVRPMELSIRFNARSRAGITIKEDFYLLKSKMRNRKYSEARHVADLIINDTKFNLKAYYFRMKINFYLAIEFFLNKDLPLIKLMVKEKISNFIS